MSTVKEHLIEHIEAYAIAKSSSNNVLIGLSVAALRQLVERLDIKERTEQPVEVDDFTTPEVPRPARSSRKAS